MMDFGFGKFLEMFEGRFGRPATTCLLLVMGLAVVAVCLNLIVTLFVVPLYRLIKDVVPGIGTIPLTATTAFYIVSFIAAVALALIPILNYLSRARRVPQRIIDDLAQLRSEAIHEVLNARVTNDVEFASWQQTHSQWRDRVINILDRHFTRAERLSFERLGLITPTTFPHAFNNEHNFQLMMFAKQLGILEEIIARHTR